MIQENFSLKPFNTFGIDVHARFFSRFNNVESLRQLLDDLKQMSGLPIDTPLVLGGGSNVLFTGDVNRLVIKNEISGIRLVAEDEDHVYLQAGAGVNWHQFVLYCLENNYAGVENLSLIPGNVGASPMQNIGAYGVEIKDVFHELEAVHLEEQTTVVFSKTDCAFGYRESVFKHKHKSSFVITSVTYKLSKKPHFNTSYGAIEAELQKMQVKDLSIQAIAKAVINIRTSKLPDPQVIGNAGSFFKNPEVPAEKYEALKEQHPSIVGYKLDNGHVKLAAGWLIEQCGWKGYRKGDAGCHVKQALVLVNYGKASGKEIFDLSTAILDSVQDKFGVLLEREVNII
ncbi:MAG: UDP-N-acetylmuramate dehydrogenase [Bacteroidetes bacterium]|nr:UDP-N-acetylmuramate dehydrogenase [Bacteroidota bacterium]